MDQGLKTRYVLMGGEGSSTLRFILDLLSSAGERNSTYCFVNFASVHIIATWQISSTK